MQRRIKEQSELRRYFVLVEDGYYVYWPPQEKRGALGSRHLRWIADELDKANEALDVSCGGMMMLKVSDEYLRDLVADRIGTNCFYVYYDPATMQNMARELLAARKVVEAVHETLDVNEWAQIAIALHNYDEVTR